MEHRKNGGEYREKQMGSKKGLSSLSKPGTRRRLSDVLFLGAICPFGRFVPWDVLSLLCIVPWDVLSVERYFLGLFVCASKIS